MNRGHPTLFVITGSVGTSIDIDTGRIIPYSREDIVGGFNLRWHKGIPRVPERFKLYIVEPHVFAKVDHLHKTRHIGPRKQNLGTGRESRADLVSLFSQGSNIGHHLVNTGSLCGSAYPVVNLLVMSVDADSNICELLSHSPEKSPFQHGPVGEKSHLYPFVDHTVDKRKEFGMNGRLSPP